MAGRTTVSGSFFEGNLEQRMVKAVNRGLTDIAIVAQGRVRRELTPGHGRRTGTLQRSVMGWVYRDLHAKVDAGEKVFGRNLIYSYWVEGVSTLNNRSVFKGYRMFRSVYEWMKRKPKVIEDYFGEQ